MKSISLTHMEIISGGEPNWGEFANGFCVAMGLGAAVGLFVSGFSGLSLLGGSCGAAQGIAWIINNA